MGNSVAEAMMPLPLLLLLMLRLRNKTNKLMINFRLAHTIFVRFTQFFFYFVSFLVCRTKYMSLCRTMRFKLLFRSLIYTFGAFFLSSSFSCYVCLLYRWLLFVFASSSSSLFSRFYSLVTPMFR